MKTFIEHYHGERNHQGLGNELINGTPAVEVGGSRIRRRQRLGGLLNYYYRAAWCVAGTVFETPSHAGQPGARIPFVEEVASAVKIPVIAIGGIKPEHVGPLRQAGAYGVATIRGADWERTKSVYETDPSPGKTRLAGAVNAAAREPITRYISAYDRDWSERDNHPDGERRAPGDTAG